MTILGRDQLESRVWLWPCNFEGNNQRSLCWCRCRSVTHFGGDFAIPKGSMHKWYYLSSRCQESLGYTFPLLSNNGRSLVAYTHSFWGSLVAYIHSLFQTRGSLFSLLWMNITRAYSWATHCRCPIMAGVWLSQPAYSMWCPGLLQHLPGWWRLQFVVDLQNQSVLITSRWEWVTDWAVWS